MKQFRLLIPVLAAIAFSACVAAENNTANSNSAGAGERAAEAALASHQLRDAEANRGEDKDPALSAGKDIADTGSPVERKIVRNADLSLEAPEPAEVLRKIASIAEAKGGFVISSEESSAGELTRDRSRVTVTIRVPAARFDDALVDIRKTATRVVVEKITGQDVTEEFVDLEARLKTKKALEEQTLAILKRAGTVEDALRVQRELSEVRGEVEQIQGRMRYLQNQSALSTIVVSIRTPSSVTGNSGGFFYELREVFSDGVENALSFILILFRFVLAVIPFLLLVVLPLALVVRYGIKRYGKQDFVRPAEKRSVFDEPSDN